MNDLKRANTIVQAARSQSHDLDVDLDVEMDASAAAAETAEAARTDHDTNDAERNDTKEKHNSKRSCVRASSHSHHPHHDHHSDDDDFWFNKFMTEILRKTVLRPHFYLRRQLFLSYGTTALFAVSFFMCIGLLAAILSGQTVIEEARRVQHDLAKQVLGTSARYAAETVTKKIHNFETASDIIRQVTMDRIVGYSSTNPDFLNMTTTDDQVPFVDYDDTSRRIYPLNTPNLWRLDWNTTTNIYSEKDNREHLQGRQPWYGESSQVSTAYGCYFMQGTCDPNATAGTPAYYPECDESNNDITTGGAVAPSPMNQVLVHKSKDLIFLFKALFESHEQLKQLGVYFANGGSGSFMKFPSQTRNGQGTHTSAGCDWMNATLNPLTGNRLFSEEEYVRCRYKPSAPLQSRTDPVTGEPYSSTTFLAREYNPLQRPWCIRQARAKPGTPVATGPYLDSSSTDPLWVMTIGHGIFDRITNEFIGCTLLDVTIDDLRIDFNRLQFGYSSAVALVRWNDEDQEPGMVAACGNCGGFDLTQLEPYHIADLQDDLGVDDDLFRDMLNLVDYNSTWDPAQISSIYAETMYERNDQLVMLHPVPNLPSVYDPAYRPQFMVIVAISTEEVFEDTDIMTDIVQSDIYVVVRNICFIGASSLLFIFLFLTWVSRSLTQPLLWMQETTSRVVSNAGSNDLTAGTGVSGSGTTTGYSCLARHTEVSVLLSEFEMMMDNFSGKGAAEVAESRIVEVRNKFQWREDYQVLYQFDFGNNALRSDDEEESHDRASTIADFASVRTERSLLSGLTEFSIFQSIRRPYDKLTMSLSKSISSIASAGYQAGGKWAQLMLEPNKDEIPDYLISPPKVNMGPNLRAPQSAERDEKGQTKVSSSSRVFWWVSCIIGIITLLTATAILATREVWIRGNLGKWLGDVKNASVVLERDAIVSATLARSEFGKQVIFQFTRDLNVISRTSGWLLLGGLERSEGFTTMDTGAEECKGYVNTENVCPADLDTVCDCSWNDFFQEVGECTFNPSNGRFVQHSTYEGQKSDIDQVGNRIQVTNGTGAFPLQTDWWDDPNEMPGAEKGSNAHGFATTYDRVRVLSALSVIQFPVYNYPRPRENEMLGTFVGLEADGMMLSFTGCDKSGFSYSSFQSTVENRAAEIAPDLCPLGRFGYDARCREWYDEAKRRGFYIMPRYDFASSDVFGSTVAKAILDPQTSETIGIVGLDFLPWKFLNALGPGQTKIGKGERGFAFLITAADDGLGGNTIFAPNYEFGVDGSINILNLITPNDEYGSNNKQKLHASIQTMQAGNTGSTTFTRKSGSDEEVIFLSYAPINLSLSEPTDPRSFANGIEVNPRVVYSLGIAIAERDLLLRYEDVEAEVDLQLEVARAISIAAMVAFAFVVVLLTYYISLNIVRPIVALTKIVKSIKNKSLRDEIPDVEGGSREISFVHESLQGLLKVVRFANTAFFAGDRTKSMHSMEDALQLFIKLGNQKAIGVAYNNLGTMVLQEQMESYKTERLFDNSLFGICISEVYFVGINYFNEAIKHGSFEYELSKDAIDQGDYAKQLANRYFNRGMFLVVVCHHPLCPTWIKDDGINDLLQAKELDRVVLELLQLSGESKEKDLDGFERALRRTSGILSLVQKFGIEDPWGITSLIEYMEAILHEAEFTSPLFDSVSRIGRQQQIDDLKIQHALCCEKNYITAAVLAMRMLVEDEYIIDTIIVNAVNAVGEYFKAKKTRIPSLNPSQYLKRHTRRAQRLTHEPKNIFFCLDYSGSMAGERIKQANKNLLWIYKEFCQDKDEVGFIRFNHSIDENLWFPLGKKGEWGVVQEAVIKKATNAEGGSRLFAALNRCVTQILDKKSKSDTWIVALTDGDSSWDHPAKKVADRIKSANKNNNNKGSGAMLHVIIIGYEVPESAIKMCQVVTSVTDKSLYVDARGGLEEMDKAFEQAVSIIAGNAVTMETF